MPPPRRLHDDGGFAPKPPAQPLHERCLLAMKATTIPGPLDVRALPSAACTTVLWRMKGQLQLTVIAKATFLLVPDGPMQLAEPEPIVSSEVHHRNVPTRSVCRTSDLAP